MDSKVLNKQFGYSFTTEDVVEKMVSKAHPLPQEANKAKPTQPE